MSDRIMNSRKTRRRLAPSEKYEMFVSVLTGQATQREAAAKWKVDRSTVVHICRTAKQGRWMLCRRRCRGAALGKTGIASGTEMARSPGQMP